MLMTIAVAVRVCTDRVSGSEDAPVGITCLTLVPGLVYVMGLRRVTYPASLKRPASYRTDHGQQAHNR